MLFFRAESLRNGIKQNFTFSSAKIAHTFCNETLSMSHIGELSLERFTQFVLLYTAHINVYAVCISVIYTVYIHIHIYKYKGIKINYIHSRL